MAEMITTREAAELWNLTPRRVTTLCKDGRIAGAVLDGNRWMIDQIERKKYGTEMKTRGISRILKYGVAFSGKHAEICSV